MDLDAEFLENVRRQNENAFYALSDWDQERESPQSRSLGDVVQLYDVCGRMGLCPGCRRRGITKLLDGCQKHYVAGRVRGIADGD